MKKEIEIHGFFKNLAIRWFFQKIDYSKDEKVVISKKEHSNTHTTIIVE